MKLNSFFTVYGNAGKILRATVKLEKREARSWILTMVGKSRNLKPPSYQIFLSFKIALGSNIHGKGSSSK